MARKNGDYYSSGEGWLKSIIIFVGALVLATVCIILAFSSANR